MINRYNIQVKITKILLKKNLYLIIYKIIMINHLLINKYIKIIIYSKNKINLYNMNNSMKNNPVLTIFNGKIFKKHRKI